MRNDAVRAMNSTENVKKQYADDTNLSIRFRLHQQYSTNKQGFSPWLHEQYRFAENCRILELGCGNGGQWEGMLENLPKGARLLLSDFSTGMLDAARTKHSKFDHVEFQQIDIQNIPFDKDSFDVVIANHMLYHIPDLDKALSEVNRVLKSGGVFYAATNGDGGMHAFLRDAFQCVNLDAKAFSGRYSFSLQNGGEILRRHFTSVERRDYEDALAISETKDLMDWLRSAISIAYFTEIDLDRLYKYFEHLRIKDGFIHIPKEVGLFICGIVG